MSMDEALGALKKTVNDWNAWRAQHPEAVLQFTNCDLRGLTLDTWLDNKMISEAGANLSGIDFSGSDLSNSDFRDADLSNAIFRDTILENVSFWRANCSGADFSRANLRKSRFHKAIVHFVLTTYSDQLEKYLSHQKYLIRLERELSKPVRRYDKELDYLPSQYLCEYVKSLGYDAIEYGSSLRNGGINLAVFNDGKLEPRSVEVYEITGFNLGFNPIVP